MRIQFAAILGGVALIAAAAPASFAEEKVQAVVSSNGRIVFTNLMENTTPAPTMVNAPVPQPVIPQSGNVLALEVPESLRNLVDTISINHGVDPALVRAVIKTESNFNRWAVSNKGARGLMQLIPETGLRYGVRDFFDPQQNVEGGVQYLKFLLEKFNGNLDLSLAAYNAGENLVERLGRIPPIQETTNYVRRVRANYVRTSGVTSVPAMAVNSGATQPGKEAKQDMPSIFRMVDERGVVHFSNVGPPK